MSEPSSIPAMGDIDPETGRFSSTEAPAAAGAGGAKPAAANKYAVVQPEPDALERPSDRSDILFLSDCLSPPSSLLYGYYSTIKYFSE